MRSKQDRQGVLQFQQPTLKVTAQFYAKYEGIDRILNQEPGILAKVHRDLEKPLKSENRGRKRRCQITSDNVLRILIAKTIEAETYRGIVVRVDDSYALRQFVRIHDGPMMCYSTLNKLANCIQPATWKKINELLGKYAVQNELITGERLRLDTTAVETNIHWPSDSSLLWDTYRVLARLIERTRESIPSVVGMRRLHVARAKDLCVTIHRRARNKATTSQKLKKPYKKLLALVEGILAWSLAVANGLKRARDNGGLGVVEYVLSQQIEEALRHFVGLGKKVVDQTERRVFRGEQVPNDEKLFSIFEPHTELLKRGKAGKPIEFGHMILLQQVDGTFITDYSVCDRKPVEHELVEPAVGAHKKLFGSPPSVITADKGFYGGMESIAVLEEGIDVVSIGKKGRRTCEELERETDVLFRIAQRFRAGIEGTISFLKRCLRLLRCFNNGVDPLSRHRRHDGLRPQPDRAGPRHHLTLRA